VNRRCFRVKGIPTYTAPFPKTGGSPHPYCSPARATFSFLFFIFFFFFFWGGSEVAGARLELRGKRCRLVYLLGWKGADGDRLAPGLAGRLVYVGIRFWKECPVFSLGRGLAVQAAGSHFRGSPSGRGGYRDLSPATRSGTEAADPT